MSNLFQKTWCSLKSKTGFTLVETLVSASLFTLLFGASVSTLMSGQESWQVNTTKSEVQDQVRKAFNRIENELIQSGSSHSGITVGAAPVNAVTFQMVTGVGGGSATWSGNITFAVDVANKKLLRNNVEIAQHIKSISFERTAADPNIVVVTIQGEKNAMSGNRKPITVTGTLKVYLRV